MFVESHIYKDPDGTVFKMKHVKSLNAHDDIYMTFMLDDLTSKSLSARLLNDGVGELEKRVISCPTCGATLNQSERVECECGWCAEAISQEFGGELYKLQMEGDVANWGVGLQILNVDLNHDEGLMYRVHYINDIHWLETKLGESDES